MVQPVAETTATVEVTSDACSQLPLRILGLHAQRGLIADRFEFRCNGSQLKISLVMPSGTSQIVEIFVEKIRRLIGFQSQQWSFCELAISKIDLMGKKYSIIDTILLLGIKIKYSLKKR